MSRRDRASGADLARLFDPDTPDRPRRGAQRRDPLADLDDSL